MKYIYNYELLESVHLPVSLADQATWAAPSSLVCCLLGRLRQMTFAVSASLAVLALLRHAAVAPAQTLAARPSTAQSRITVRSATRVARPEDAGAPAGGLCLTRARSHRPPRRCQVRSATRSELQAWRDNASIFTPLSELCAECLFSPASKAETAQLSQEMHRNLVDRFSALNNRRHVLLLAEDDRGAIVGSCGVEASPLTPEGRATPRLPTDLARMDMRPLLSNLVVAPEHRRRGVAKRLMREAEAHARGWGFEELLLKARATCVHVVAPARSLARETPRPTARPTLRRAERKQPLGRPCKAPP